MEKGKVCVTGASGHLGSWLVMRLLQRGYLVHATVLNLNDKSETSILSDLPGAAQNLKLFEANLMKPNDFQEPIKGCDGVFHLACPTNFSSLNDPFDMIDPAVQGTLNVLESCKEAVSSVKRVVYVSSLAAVRFCRPDFPGQVIDESCWTSVDTCQQLMFHGWPYFVGKTLAEKSAYEFAEKNNINLLSILPALVTGPFLIPRMPNSVSDALSIVRGDTERFSFLKWISYVHIEDVVDAMIFLYENSTAQGRHICSTIDAPIQENARIIGQNFPELNIPTNFGFLGEIVPHYMDSSKLKKLGFRFKYNLEDMLTDSVGCCKEKGIL